MTSTLVQQLQDLSSGDRFEALSALCVGAAIAKGIEIIVPNPLRIPMLS